MTATVLLVAGYPVAVVVLARFRSVLIERQGWWFAALEGATAGIVVGWWLRGRVVAVAVNAAAAVGFGVAWWVAGRRGGRRR